MAHDDELAARVRALLAGEPGWGEKAMFGGLAFLRDGHMAVAASGSGGLMVRCDPEDHLLAEAHTEPVVMRGRELTGWVLVTADGLADDADLARWVARGAARVHALHPTPRG